MQHRLTSALIAATALVGLAACGSDTTTTPPAAAGVNTTIAGAGAPTDSVAPTPVDGATTVPAIPGVNADRMAIVQAISASAMAASGQGNLAESQAAIQGLVNGVPDELKADAQIFADAFSQYLAVLAQYEGDFEAAMQAPEAMAALQAISTPEVQAASNRISEYMDANCQN